MSGPVITASAIGREGEPLVKLDGLVTDPDALRAAAASADFVPAGEHYPGIRAALPPGYLAEVLPVIGRAVRRHIGSCRRIHVVDASFSVVTTPAAELHLRQRLPHVDAYGRERIALIHYLSPAGGDGTAFFRHRATGFETIDAARAPGYTAQLDGQLSEAETPSGYIVDDTTLFERTHLAAAQFNRALLYRSYLLHSGAISDVATLSPDPLAGRLTVTGFFAVE